MGHASAFAVGDEAHEEVKVVVETFAEGQLGNDDFGADVGALTAEATNLVEGNGFDGDSDFDSLETTEGIGIGEEFGAGGKTDLFEHLFATRLWELSGKGCSGKKGRTEEKDQNKNEKRKHRGSAGRSWGKD